jgi:hypothetical protein
MVLLRAPAAEGIPRGSQVLAGSRHRGVNVDEAETDNVVVGFALTVGIENQHPAGSPPAANRVALVPYQHRRPVTVEDGVVRIEIVLKQAAAGVGQDDYPDSRKFLIVELADLASRFGHEQTLASCLYLSIRGMYCRTERGFC